MAEPATPWVSGVVLAAGRSRRFGERLKQLVEVGGEALVRRAARAAVGSRLSQVLLVVGHHGAEVAAAVADLPLEVVVNAAYGEGQSTSVRAGLAAVDPRAAAALFLPADQPFLDAAVLDRLIEAYAASGGPVVVPAHRGRRGAPALFDRSLFAELARLRGDVGGRRLIASRPEAVVEVELASGLALIDVDGPADLARLSAEG